VYCTIGYRSSAYVNQIGSALDAQGVTVHNLFGGILNWIASGGELIDANGQITKIVHTYGAHWKAVPDGYVTLEFSTFRLFWERVLMWVRNNR
jgi:hypothetical protein